MSRSFVAALNRMVREAERAAKAPAREQAALIRQQQKDAKLLSKQDRLNYFVDRQTNAESFNRQLAATNYALANLLPHSLPIDPTIDVNSLKKAKPTHAIFSDRPDLTIGSMPTRNSAYVPPLGFFAGLIPGARAKHASRVATAAAEADADYAERMRNYETVVQRRAEALSVAIVEADEFNGQIDDFNDALNKSQPGAVTRYFELVFLRSNYPAEFQKKYRIAYVKDSRQLVVDYQMPLIDEIIPTTEKYKYTKSADEISETRTPERIRHQHYADAVSSVVLRMLHEVFAADQLKSVDVAAINAYVDTIDRSTGQNIQPYILSARTTRDEFERLVLQNVDPTACLKRLTASISRSPAELVPIKPIVDINMVDPRFIEEQDILSAVDNRTNLMTLSPTEFESLITNLFQRMGLETKLTQPSRDGGVDCVAFDQRPILGGKVVVQAKRYRNTVGVGSVRDFFGTMLNEGASKGILVTTSGYGKASFEFANGKPIELISGSNLLYLLREHAGVEAKIEPPEDWVDFREAAQ
jgi:restriction system protein